MKKVIFDCDNTMGLPGKDVDDGLALLYLLGRDDIVLKGVTTTYGNSTLDEVYNNTERMFSHLGLTEVPLIRGAYSKAARISEAAEFLSREAASNPGEITVLATGSLTNLYGAYMLDSDFFKNIKEIVLMGGITEPLFINKVYLEELNFSCDSLAALKVLNTGDKVSILTGNTCLQAFFGETELRRLKGKNKNSIYKYISKNIEPWYDFSRETFGIYGFHNWDVVAAVYVTNPELFNNCIKYIKSTETDLATGLIKICSKNEVLSKINIPEGINNIERFKDIIFEAWDRV
ncbi:MAG: nucleoside hydrolase [Solirubrobacterales bacterium]